MTALVQYVHFEIIVEGVKSPALLAFNMQCFDHIEGQQAMHAEALYLDPLFML